MQYRKETMKQYKNQYKIRAKRLRATTFAIVDLKER